MEKSFLKISNLAHASFFNGEIEMKLGVSSFYLTTRIGGSTQGNGLRDMFDNKESWK